MCSPLSNFQLVLARRFRTGCAASVSRNVVPPLTLLPLTLLYSTHTVDSNLDGNAKAPSVPMQRMITAHLMRLWPSHQYVLGSISLSRSEQSLGLQSSQRFKACLCKLQRLLGYGIP